MTGGSGTVPVMMTGGSGTVPVTGFASRALAHGENFHPEP